MIAPRDFLYVGLPWKAGGRSRDGVDCVGLAQLFLRDELGLDVTAPKSDPCLRCEHLIEKFQSVHLLGRGDVVFFKRGGRICHVATHLGGGRLLHILNGVQSRIDNGFALLDRIGLEPVGFIPAQWTRRLCAALRDPTLGEAGTIIAIVGLVVSLALSAAAAALTPKLGRQGNPYGRYSFDALITKTDPEIPLPDLLGTVVIAGNSPYTQQSEKGASATPSQQRANKVVILASGPVSLLDYQTGLKVNGLSWMDKFWNGAPKVEGIFVNPGQTAAEAVDGTILTENNVPSVSLYDGAHGISVPVDVRAQYDRDFPIYGFSGCAYAVFRMIDSTKWSNFNLTQRIKGRKCRTFNTSGFIQTTVTGESLTGANAYTAQAVTADSSTERITLASHALSDGDRVKFGGTAVPGGLTAGVWYYVVNKTTNDFQVSSMLGGSAINLTSNGTAVTMDSEGKVRFKLVNDDIASVSSLTVGVTSYSEMSATNQSGNVYSLNRLKGYVEFLTAPAAGSSISITYKYYPREFSQNPAMQVIYLLTEVGRGRGLDESRIDWPAAVAFRDHCDEDVTWNSSFGTITEDRYKTNYAVDFRKPIQEHIRAILDGCNGDLFVSNGKFILGVRKTATSVFSFNTSNIVEGSFSSEMLDRTERANRIKLFFHTEDSLNAETEVIIDDVVDQANRAPRAGNNGVVDENLKLPAVTSQSQAERLAAMSLREQVEARWLVELTTNIKGLALQPDDVVDITHPSQSTWSAKLFRIEEISHDGEDRLVVRAIEYVEAAFV